MADRSRVDIEADLRSVVQSTKGGVPLRSIQGDFRSLTGNFIPFSKFGYASLEAMLKDMPHVIRLERRNDGEVIVHAVANPETQHLSDLIAKQKPSKAKPITKPRRLMGNQNWRPPHSQRSPNPLPSRPPSRNSTRGPPFRGHWPPPPPSTSPQHNYYKKYPQYSPPPPNKGQNYEHYSWRHLNHPPQAQPPRHEDPAHPRQALLPLPVKTNSEPPRHEDPAHTTRQTLLPLPVKTNFQPPPRFQKLSPLITSQPQSPQETSPKLPSPAQSATSPSFSPDAPEFIPRPEFKSSSVVTSYVPPQAALSSTPSSTSPTPEELGLPWPNPKSNKQVIDNYVFTNGLKCVYRPFATQNKKQKITWLSQLIIDDQKFLSYPVEMLSAEEANEEAAKRAVEKLNIDPNVVSLPVVPTGTAQDVERMVEQVRQIVSENPQGAFHYHVQEQFKKRHKKRLPTKEPNWLDFLENNELFRIDKPDETHYILFYEKSARSTPEMPGRQPTSVENHTENVVWNGSSKAQPSSGDGSDSETDFQSYLPDAMTLPDSKYWDVYITHASSTTNVCFRLIDYSDDFEIFTQNMEKHYLNNQNTIEPVLYPVCGTPHCAFVDNTWHRVIVQNVDGEGKVLCDFPDVGDSEWLEGSSIFELDKKFLEFPFQCIRAELAGLSCFGNDAVISEMLVRSVFGKALVAEPTEKDNDNIVMVLYDTSTEDDVNLNKSLLEEIFAEIKPPALSQLRTLVDGFLGDVLPTGVIQLHVVGRSSQLLNQLLENVTDILQAQSKEKPVTQVLFSEIYCVFYRDKWHRAVPVSDVVNNNKVTMLLIDVGIQRDIEMFNICQLEGETKTLCNFPPLAVRCHLNGINCRKWTEKAKEKLKQLIPEGTPLLIKVASKMSDDQLPFVDLFKRLLPNKDLVSINQTLAICFPDPSLELNGKVQEPLERKLSQPTSFQAPSPPPPLNRSASFNQSLSCPTTPLTAITGYSFTHINGSSVQDQVHGSVTPPVVETSPEMQINRQEDVPEVKDFFEVFITSAANPNTFTCQSRKALTNISDLFEEMQQFYNSEDNICEMHICLIHVGEFFALKRSDGFWYRVHVQEIFVYEPCTMLVYLVDYGGFETANLSDVQILYQQFRKLPYQAISASLSGIQPANVDYTPSDCLVFKKMIQDNSFVSIISSKEPKDLHGLKGLHLHLTLVDTSTEEDVYIHEELVKRGISKRS